MAATKLDFYAIRLHIKGKPEHFVNFDDVFEDGSFSDFFKKFAEKFALRQDNMHDKKTFKFQPSSLKFDSGNRIVSGIIKGGVFGSTSEVENVRTGEAKPPITNDDSIINPYYFLIYFPEKSSIGLVILQRKGLNGITTDFRNYFKHFIDTEIGDYKLEMSPYASKKALLNMIRESSVSQISIKKYNNTSDDWDKYRDRAGKNSELNSQFILTAKNIFGSYTKSEIESFIDDPRANFFQLKELENLGFNGNLETSVRLEKDGREKIVILNDVEKFKLSFDVSNDIKFDSNNHPNFISIDNEAKYLLKEHFNV